MLGNFLLLSSARAVSIIANGSFIFTYVFGMCDILSAYLRQCGYAFVLRDKGRYIVSAETIQS